MASKQLGKLRQWAGEVISSRDKTTVSEEFRELEKDIELRREGAMKLLAASEAYQYTLAKKKKNEAFEDAEKLLPIDTLGIVMIVHGEEFGEDSAFGTSLVKLGRAHCKVATLQEAFALTFNDTFISSVAKFIEDIKEYDTQRKKLESKRLSYDAAVAKFEKLKGSKKEKEKREAEEEMERAKQRYEETSEDTHSQMHAIQDNEVVQLRDLTSLLDSEIKFVEQYLNVLKDVKGEWYDGSTLAQPPPRGTGPAHVFARPSSSQSKRSVRSRTKDNSDSSDDIDERSSKPTPSRRSSIHKRSDSNTSKPPSRPASRASKKRSESVDTIGDKDERDKSRRMSVTSWVGSVTGRGRKGRDKFTSLNDDEPQRDDGEDDERGIQPKKSSSFPSISKKLSGAKSKESLQSGSPKSSAKILKPPSLQGKKIVRALYNFTGSTDELSFNVGDEIVVINEVLDGWWMGELGGKKGLFPTTHVEIVARSSLPKRPPSTHDKDVSSSYLFDDMGGSADDNSSLLTNDLDEDHDLTKQPLSASHTPFYGGLPDAASITSSTTENEDDNLFLSISRGTPPTSFKDSDDDYFQSNTSSRSSSRIGDKKPAHSLNASPQPPFARRSTTTEMSTSTSTPGRKAPPPPPPRRPTITPLPTPPVPERPYRTFGTHSSSSLKVPTPASSVSGHSYDRSPFESVTDLPSTATEGCGDFKQNPFQAKGMCDNCFRSHG